jgi:hypothetical protein
MKKILLCGVIITLIGFNCSRKAVEAPIPFNLADESQQSDFKNYLEVTLIFLNDRPLSNFFKGYNLSNLSDKDKAQIGNNMTKDPNFMDKMNSYIRSVRYIENKYKASKFSKEQWRQIAKFGVNEGIYFMPGLKERVKLMEEKAIALLHGKDNVAAPCCVCSDQVDAANAQLAESVAQMTITCLAFAEVPVAAALCYAGVTAFYLEENSRINSTEYWCDCMIANYGVCVY